MPFDTRNELRTQGDRKKEPAYASEIARTVRGERLRSNRISYQVEENFDDLKFNLK